MSGSPINIGGVNFGSPNASPKTASEPAAKIDAKAADPKSDSPPTSQTRAGKLLAATKERGAPPRFVRRSVTVFDHDGYSLFYESYTDNPDEFPYSHVETLTRYGHFVNNVVIGSGNAAVLYSGSHGHSSRTIPKSFSETLNKEIVAAGHTAHHVRFFTCGWIAFSEPVGWWQMGLPATLIERINKFRASGIEILDVAVDSQGAWVAVAEGQTAMLGVPKELEAKIKQFAQRKDPIISIPHFEGDSWFINTAKRWYSANLPQQLYKSLTQQTVVKAFAISPDGQWMVQAVKPVPKKGSG